MSLQFQQTDTNISADQWCATSTHHQGGGNRYRSAEVGGDVGSVAVATGNLSNNTNWSGLCGFHIDPGNVDWNPGTWTVRVNITTANANLHISAVFICRLDSSDVSQSIIGSLTGLSVTCTAGVKVFNVSGSSQTPTQGDRIGIVCIVSNTSGQMNQSMAWTPSELIDTPLVAEEIPEYTASGAAALQAATGAGTATFGATYGAEGAAALAAIVAAGAASFETEDEAVRQLFVGGAEVIDVRVGSAPVQAVYVGDKLVWER